MADAPRRFYAVILGDRPHRKVFQLYEVVDGRLDTVWPPDPHMCGRARLLPYQVFSLREGLPAFHFKIVNPVADWRPRFVEVLQTELGYPVEVIVLSGDRLYA